MQASRTLPSASASAPVRAPSLHSEAGACRAAIATACAATAVFLGLPELLGLLGDQRGYNAGQLGQVASASTLGLAVTALLGPWALRRFHARGLMMVGLLLLALFQGLSALAPAYLPFAGLQLAASVAAGIAMPAAMAVLGRAADPERAFSHLVATQIVLSTLELLAFGPAARSWGLGSLFVALAALALLAALLCWRAALPANVGQAEAGPASITAKISGAAWAMIAAVLCFFAAIGAYWAFIERAGVQSGFAAEELGLWLAASNAPALLGSLLAPWCARRIGERRTLAVGLMLAVVVPLFLLVPTGRYGYLLNLACFVILWNSLMVVQMAVLGRWDPLGQAVSLTPAAQGLGLALGPLAAGALAESSGFVIAVAGASALALLGWLANEAAFRLRRRSAG
jgi:DHA1 family inner membrane transport protein